MCRKHNVAIFCIGEAVVLPVGLYPCGPIIDNERHILVEVPPRSLHRASIKVLQGFTRKPTLVVWAVGLIQQLNSPTGRCLLGTDTCHALYGQLTLLAVPVGIKIEVAVFAKITTSVLVAALPARSRVQVHQNLDACRLCILKHPVYPLSVRRCGHEVLQVPEPCRYFLWATGGGGVREVDQVPVAQRYTDNVEAELYHVGKVLRLDIHVKKLGHAVPCIGSTNITQTEIL
mmetsp:Transcript_23562/g.45772  ORF Transcript_23562/g.45772 Transcript_23562/m.45772 type:complete len:231 (+) Transcript_23562:826-1518(+)